MHSTDASIARRNGRSLAVWSAIYLGIAAATLPAVLPVMVGVMADKLGFGVVQAGYVASANLGGVAIGSVVCAFSARRWAWRGLIKSGAATMIVTNFLTTLFASFPLIATMRFVSGLGEGVVSAICYAAMSRSPNSARALAFYLAGQGLTGAVGMGMMPSIVARMGWPWLFVLISVVAFPGFWLARSIETLRAEPDNITRPNVRATPWHSGYALACILVFFVGMSAVWSFTERMGHAKGIDLRHLSIALSGSSIANMAGCLLVALSAHRLNTLVGLATGSSVALAGFLALIASSGWQAYLCAVSLFFFAWGFYYPFQFKQLARIDASGRAAVLVPLMTGGGLTLGPAIGGLLLASGGDTLICTFGALCVVVSTAGATHLHFHSARKGAAA